MKVCLTIVLSVLAGLMAACSATSPTSSTIDKMERTWREQNIASYRIEVMVVRSIWHAQSQQITIQNNQVEASTASCIPAPIEAGKCKVEEFAAEDFTVPGLFDKVRVQTQSEWAAWVKITYDPVYGFPSQISYDHPEMIDEDWSWRVTAFEVLK